MSLQKITRAGIIAALYVLMTVIGYSWSFGPIQFRFSEALCILPLLFPESAVGLTVGCFISNVFGGYGIYDVIIGSAATCLGAFGTMLVGKYLKNVPLKLVCGVACPVLANSFLVPLIFLLTTTAEQAYFYCVLTLFVSEAVVIAALGIPLYFIVEKAFSRTPNG